MTQSTTDIDTAAAEVRRLIDEIGGVVSLTDLARRWEITRTRIHQLAHHADFPPPVLTVNEDTKQPMKLYSLRQAEAFRYAQRRGPAPKPPHATA